MNAKHSCWRAQPSRGAGPEDVVLEGANVVLEGAGVELEGAGVELEGAGDELEGAGVELEGARVELEGAGVVLEGGGLVVAQSSVGRRSFHTHSLPTPSSPLQVVSPAVLGAHSNCNACVAPPQTSGAEMLGYSSSPAPPASQPAPSNITKVRVSPGLPSWQYSPAERSKFWCCTSAVDDPGATNAHCSCAQT